MTIKEIFDFDGIHPRTDAALLPDHGAQLALNCTLWQGDLRPLAAPLQVVTPTAVEAGIRSIYRIGQDLPETQYWLAWPADVDVVRGLIAGDTSERTYYTGDGVPKVTNLELATQGGTQYPVNAYTLGIPKPATAPTCAASSADQPVETRVYVYTYVSAFGEEGIPSDPAKVDVSEDGTVSLSDLSAAPTGNFNIVSKRIYRSQQASDGSAIYLFVDEIAVALATYDDTKSSTDLGEEISTIGYDMPPETMAGLVALPNGILAAFDGYDILFCEPFLPYAWPQAYRLTADYPVVGLGVFGSSLVVCTKGYPYVITGVDPSSMSMERMDLAQSCVSKRSIVSSDDGVVFASPDGLVFVGAGGAQIITQNHYTRKEWQALNPASIDAYWTDGKYVAVYDGGGFILDATDNGRLTTFDDTATAGYVDPVEDALYLCIDGNIMKFNAGADKTFSWRSKKFQYTGHVSPSFARVDADAYPVTLDLYVDGALAYSVSVASERPFPLPVPGRRPREVEVALSGTRPIRYVGIADAVEEFPIG